MYQRIGAAAYKKDLGNTLALCSFLNNPQETFKSIHVAGTNGKGSSSHMLASVFQEHGYKTGLYTSPHLIDFRERIRLDGVEVDEAFVVDFVNRIRPILEEVNASFFEITVAMAFTYFAEHGVDIAIIETGLGGRLDSTNVITPELSLITNIGLDHTDMLGDSLAAIAFEKAGIIKPGVPVVIGERHPETTPVFEKKATDSQSELHFAQEMVRVDEVFATDLLGSYQVANACSVQAALNLLKSEWKLNDEKTQRALLNVANNTGMKGRWQVLSTHPKVICDTGHNVEGITGLVNQLNQEDFEQLHMVFGQVKGKNSSDILRLLPKDARYYFCQPDVIRGLDVNELEKLARDSGLNGSVHNRVEQAYQKAMANASENDLVFIGGSTFVVADLLTYLGQQAQR